MDKGFSTESQIEDLGTLQKVDGTLHLEGLKNDPELLKAMRELKPIGEKPAEKKTNKRLSRWQQMTRDEKRAYVLETEKMMFGKENNELPVKRGRGPK